MDEHQSGEYTNNDYNSDIDEGSGNRMQPPRAWDVPMADPAPHRQWSAAQMAEMAQQERNSPPISPAPPPSDAPYRLARVADPSMPLPRGPRERRRVARWVPLAGGCLVSLAVVMALCAAAAGVLWGVTIGSARAASTVTRSATVSGTPTVSVQIDAGNVRVVRGDADQVTATLTKEVHAISQQQARQDLDQITLDLTKTGNTVSVTTHAPSFSFKGIPWFTHQSSVELLVTVPQTTNVNATLGAGNLTISHLTGALTVDASYGNVKLTDLTVTNQATLHMQAGNLIATYLTGSVAATLGYGNATFNGTTLTQDSSLHANAGNIDFDGTLRPGVSLDASDQAGNVTLSLPRATAIHLDATTNAGNLTVSGWPVSVSGNSAGKSASGNLSANPSGTLTVHTDAGNITLQPRD